MMTRWPPYRMHHLCDRGFTLLELMVVLLIIGISSALVLPHLGQSLPGVKLKAAARQFAAALRYARSQAVSLRIPLDVHVDPNGQALSVVPVRAFEAVQPATDWVDLKSYRPPEGVRLEIEMAGLLQSGAVEMVIHFYISGSSSGGRFKLIDAQNRQFVIDVEAITGRISIEAG